MDNQEMLTITKTHFEKLLRNSHKLSCLEACGVDNWQGYGDAMELFEEEME